MFDIDEYIEYWIDLLSFVGAGLFAVAVFLGLAIGLGFLVTFIYQLIGG